MFYRAYRRLALHGRFSCSMKVLRETVKFLNGSSCTSNESMRVAGKVVPDIELLRRCPAVVTVLE